MSLRNRLVPLAALTAAALLLAGCGGSESGEAASTQSAQATEAVAAVMSGQATTAQITEVASLSFADAVNVELAQFMEVTAGKLAKDSMLASLLDMKTTGAGVVAGDGSSADVTMTMSAPMLGPDPIQTQVIVFDGKVWVLNPLTQEWEQSPDAEQLIQALDPSELGGSIPTVGEVTYAGEEEINGKTAYRYDLVATVTEELAAQFNAGSVTGQSLTDFLGEKITGSYWLSETGIVQMETRVTVSNVLAATLTDSAKELDGVTIESVTRVTVSDATSPLPTAPPVAPTS